VRRLRPPFTTRERIDEMDMPLRVVKRDNTRQSFRTTQDPLG